MKMPYYVGLLVALACGNAVADERSSQWGLGIGGIASDDPYAGRGMRYTPVPLITYDSERLFFRGITGGVHLLDTSSLEIDFIVAANFDGIDAEDFGTRELAKNGIDRALLEDRKDSADVGFALGLAGRYGELEIEALADVLDASGGYEVGATYGYPFSFGERFVITPTIGARWLSDDRADYYYGTLNKEIARGVMSYRPGSAVIPEVGVEVQYRFSDRWLLLSSLKYQSLPSKIEDSPLLESGDTSRLFIGVMKAF